MLSKVNSNDFIPLVKILEEDAGSKPAYWISFNRFFIISEENELMLRINDYTKELIITRIKVKQKRRGVATQILHFLKEYAKKNGYKKIIIEAALTKEIINFARANGFNEQPHVIGNYELLVG